MRRRPLGLMRLSAAPAVDVWHASSALSLTAIPPHSLVTVVLDAEQLLPGGLAGIAVFRRPFAWVGVERSRDGLTLVQFDERQESTSRLPLERSSVRLRVECDFVRSQAIFRYSTDGRHFPSIGVPYLSCPGGDTFQGVPCSLFACTVGVPEPGGWAQFDSFLLDTQFERRG